MPNDFLTTNLEREMKERERVLNTHLGDAPFAMMRLDGHGFSAYTKDLQRPADARFMHDMDRTALELCKSLSGAVFAWVVSDEINVLIQRDESGYTNGGSTTKLNTLMAAKASVAFTMLRPHAPATFDARLTALDNVEDVLKYMAWRQRSARANAISMAAETLFSHKTLMGVGAGDRLAMLESEGFDFNGLPEGFSTGRTVRRRAVDRKGTYVHSRTKEVHAYAVQRTEWVVETAPVFADENVHIENYIVVT